MRVDRLAHTVLLASLSLGAFSGCAGAGVEVVADHALYPISMSETVRDGSGTLLDRRSLVTVGHFESEESRIGILYSALTLRSKVDISETINAQVAAAGGEAVTHLSVTVTEGCNVLNGFFFLNAVPIWPGCVPLEIRGLIVRRKSQQPTPTPPVAGIK